jgi:Domain of unknown function (DUF4177)
MKKFEYQILCYAKSYVLGVIDFQQMQDDISRLGKEGWELVSTMDTNRNQGSTDEVVLFLKKEIA